MTNCTARPPISGANAVNDYLAWYQGINFEQKFEQQFQQNVKNGIYTLATIHDSIQDPAANFYVNGVHMSVYFENTLRYLQAQGVRYIFAHELVDRLEDYLGGSVTVTANPDGSRTVQVVRPRGLANDVKIQMDDGLNRVAVGPSVRYQTYVGNVLYVTLAPETSSTFTLYVPPTPPAPLVTLDSGYTSGTIDASWQEPEGTPEIAEYSYAVGTSPGAADVVPWTSAGISRVAHIAIQAQSGASYFVSVRSRYATGDWSTAGMAGPVWVDLTPPSTPTVLVSARRVSRSSSLYASWSTEDPESGLAEAWYAVGSIPGAADIQGWTKSSSLTSCTISGSSFYFGVYYLSVRIKNRAGLWSQAGASDSWNVSVTSLADLNAAGPGTPVDLTGLVAATATGEIDDALWAVSGDRVSGIKIQPLSGQDAVARGDGLSVQGTFEIRNGERIIVNATIQKAEHQPPPRPLGISPKAIYSGQGGPLDAQGRLVRIWGRVTSVSSDIFYVNDGGIRGSGGTLGVPVLSNGLSSPPLLAVVGVTGVVSVRGDGSTAPVVIPRSQDDITVY